MSVQVVGIGNPLRGDDGVGVRIAEAVCRRYPDVPAAAFPSVGLDVLAALAGKHHAIVVDGVETEQVEVGEVVEVQWRPRSDRPCPPGQHAMRIRDILELGRALGVAMPEKVTTLGVGIRGPFPLSDGLSEKLALRFDEMVQTVATVATGGAGEGL